MLDRIRLSFPAVRALSTFVLTAAFASALPSCASPPVRTAPAAGGTHWATVTDAAWIEMQRALTGRWKATTPQSKSITVSYRVISNGSALVETFTSTSGKETISVYHRDQPALMLTHYCAQGNQARLKATEASRERVVFVYLDATNVTAEQDVMHKLVITFRADGFDQETDYQLPNGAHETTTLHFFRTD